MSDFDKEAEREKLRKQFEEDEEKRKTTERMSELLLQGATMTNKHCDVCGNPIFRHQSQEFCPTCQAQGTDSRERSPTEQQQSEDTTQAESETTSIEIEDRTANASETMAAEPIDENNSPDHSPPPSHTPNAPSPEPPASPVRSESTSHTRTTDLSEARQSLVRTVTRFAKQAEAADELGRAQMFLTATEDAAKALEAVNRAEE